MKNIIPLVLASAVGLAVILGFTSQADPEEQLQVLHQASGLEKQLETIWENVRDETQSLSNVALSPDAVEALTPAIQQHFAEQKLRESILSHWSESLSEDDIHTITAWLQSPAGQQLTQAEIAAAKNSDDAVLGAFIQKLKENPVAQSRVELLQTLDASVAMSIHAADMYITFNLTALGILHGTSLATASAPTLEKQSAFHEDNRQLIETLIKQDLIRYNLYTYRDIDDQVLQKYIDFAESPSGQSYLKATHEAITAALAISTSKLINNATTVNTKNLPKEH